MDAAETAKLRSRLDQGLVGMAPMIRGRLDDAACDKLLAYLTILGRWNRAFNLTAVRDPREMVPRHLLDSLSVLPWITGTPVLDVGTGAGLPGIPLAIALPELRFTLLDSNGKKTRFVRQAVFELGLANVDVVQSRLETYQPVAKFATIVARAVAAITTLHAASDHLAATGARLLALKGRLPADEIGALRSAMAKTAAHKPCAAYGDGSVRIRVHPLQVPLLDGERNLIEISFQTGVHG